MKEFGSNFHYVQMKGDHTLKCDYPDAVYYATGRHALIDLYRQMGWKRLWVPEYFCYEVLGSMQREGVNLSFYADYPTIDEDCEVSRLPFENGDALLRVNYYGLRSRRDNHAIDVPVVEDHTHDLIGDWACHSDADWCIASLRKTLPLAEGGMLWSPRGHRLPAEPHESPSNHALAAGMWHAMRLKTLYLEDKIRNKSEFRQTMVAAEESMDTLELSALDQETADYIKTFDVLQWYRRKRENWSALSDIQSDKFRVLLPESSDCNPFSLTLLFNEKQERDRYRRALIDQDVYPAILWEIPAGKQPLVSDFSLRMLSIHCDARYSKDDISKLRSIIIGC